MCVRVSVVGCLHSLIYQLFLSLSVSMFVCSWWSVMCLVKMICWSLSKHLVTFLRSLFSVIDTFLNLCDWMICWVIFNKYLVCFKNNGSKYTHWFSVDDNTNNHIFFTNNTSTFKCPFSWQMVGNSILVIMYDTQSCTFGAVISRMIKSLSIRLYNNRLSLYDMFSESVFSSNTCDWIQNVVIDQRLIYH